MGLGAGCPRTPPALGSGAGGSRVPGGGGAGEPQAAGSTTSGWAGLGGAASGGCGDTAPPQGDPSPSWCLPSPLWGWGCGHGEGWGSARCLGWLWCPQSTFPGPPRRVFRGAVAHAAWPRCWGCSVSASAGGGSAAGGSHRPVGTSPRHGARRPTPPPVPVLLHCCRQRERAAPRGPRWHPSRSPMSVGAQGAAPLPQLNAVSAGRASGGPQHWSACGACRESAQCVWGRLCRCLAAGWCPLAERCVG